MPQHKVLNILNFVRFNFDMIDHRLRADWVYVIRTIASGKLYTVNFNEERDPLSPNFSGPVIKQKGATQTGMQWAKEMTKIDTQNRKSVNNTSFKFNQMEKMGSGSNKRMSLIKAGDMKGLNLKSDKLDTESVSKILKLNDESKEELKLVDTYDFNIFNLREFTKDNELATTVCYIMAKEELFETLPIENHKFLPFM